MIGASLYVAGPWLLHVVVAVVLVTLQLPGAAAQTGSYNDRTIALDFSNRGDETLTRMEEVTQGVMVLTGEITGDELSSGDLDIVIRQTLGKVCQNWDAVLPAPALSSFMMDISTYGQPRVGLHYPWWILPPVESGKDCVDKLSMVGFGPAEPPFGSGIGEQTPPPIRELFARELKLHGPTNKMKSSGWGISLTNISCDSRLVTKEKSHNKSADVLPTDSPMCLGQQGDPWKPQNGSFDLTKLGSCGSAGGNGCVCSALPLCEWIPAPSGPGRCVYTSNPGVSCSGCAFQDKCLPSPAKTCATKATPCACALSTDGCIWNTNTSGGCVYRPGELTPCTACPRSDHCSLPGIVQMSPTVATILGEKGDDWLINVTFNRPMSFQSAAAQGFSGVMLQCSGSVAYPVAGVFDLDSQRLALVNSNFMLQIDTFGLVNPGLRDCALMISDAALQDADFPFLGMQDGSYRIALPDTVPPVAINFEPANSARGLPLDAKVTIYFNENIKASKVSWKGKLILTTFGSGSGQTGATEDIPLNSQTVTMHSNAMTVDLAGKLQYSSVYSVSVPAGAVTDATSNDFAGLDMGSYTFETSASAITRENYVDNSALYIGIALAVVVIVTLLVGGGILAQRKLHSARSALVRFADADTRSGKLPDTEAGDDIVNALAVNTLATTGGGRCSGFQGNVRVATKTLNPKWTFEQEGLRQTGCVAEGAASQLYKTYTIGTFGPSLDALPGQMSRQPSKEKTVSRLPSKERSRPPTTSLSERQRPFPPSTEPQLFLAGR